MKKPTIEKLRKRAQFLFVRQGARASKGAVLVEARRRAEDGPIGVGFTASKKVGGAVVRNRAKRRLREAARQLLPEYGLAGVDYVLVARQSTPEAEWAALLDDLKNALIRLRAELQAGAEARPTRVKSLHKRPTPTESD
ncbi:MAG: ribonuclease P protein component [Hyphomonadaceae bacterium]|nr:ribonuclease P protein component [Hyphomonadaceae bacterium]